MYAWHFYTNIQTILDLKTVHVVPGHNVCVRVDEGLDHVVVAGNAGKMQCYNLQLQYSNYRTV